MIFLSHTLRAAAISFIFVLPWHFVGCNKSNDVAQTPQTNGDKSSNGESSGDKGAGNDPGTTDRSSVDGANSAEEPDLRSVLKRCSDLYQSTTVYSDKAYVSVEGTRNGKPYEIEQRCSFQYQAPNRIALAYDDMFVTTDEQYVYAVVLNDQLPELARQIYTRRLPERITPEWLAQESGIGQFLSTRLVHAPFIYRFMQDSASLENEFASAELKFNGFKTVDQRECYEIEAVLEQQSFTVAIDREDFLLRQIQFPSLALPSDTLDQFDPGTPKFVIKFELAKFELSDNFPTTERIQPNARPYFVRNFVIPPPTPSPLFGKTIDGWELTDAESQQKIDFDQFSGKVTVVAWLANHEAGIDTLKRLQVVKDQVEATEAADQVEFVVIWANPAIGNQADYRPSSDIWNGALYLDESNYSGAELGISNSPTVAIFDRRQRLQVLDMQYNTRLDINLPPVIERLVGGEDLVELMLRDYQNDRATFATELHIVAADRQRVEELPDIGPMRLRFFGLQSLNNRRVKQDIIAAGYTRGTIDPDGDFGSDRWLLTSDGLIGVFDADLKYIDVGRLPNEVNLAPLSWTVRPGPKGSNLAIVYSHSRSFGYMIEKIDDQFELSPVGLLNDEYIVAAEWIKPRDGNSRELIISTSRGRFGVVVDGEIEEVDVDIERVVGISPLLDSEQSKVGYQAIGADGKVEPIKAFSQAEAFQMSGLQRQLGFTPTPPRWLTARDRDSGFTAGIGLLPNDAAAFVLMNNNNEPVLNYAVAKHFGRVFDSGLDPVNDIPYWILESPQGVLHIVQSDQNRFGSVSWGEPIIAANLDLRNDQLVLDTIFQNRIRSWVVSTPSQQSPSTVAPQSDYENEIEDLPPKRQ